MWFNEVQYLACDLLLEEDRAKISTGIPGLRAHRLNHLASPPPNMMGSPCAHLKTNANSMLVTRRILAESPTTLGFAALDLLCLIATPKPKMTSSEIDGQFKPI